MFAFMSKKLCTEFVLWVCTWCSATLTSTHWPLLCVSLLWSLLNSVIVPHKVDKSNQNKCLFLASEVMCYWCVLSAHSMCVGTRDRLGYIGGYGFVHVGTVFVLLDVQIECKLTVRTYACVTGSGRVCVWGGVVLYLVVSSVHTDFFGLWEGN